PFERWLAPVMEHHGEAEAATAGAGLESLLMLASLAVAAGGIGLAYRMYASESLRPETFSEALGGRPYRAVLNKYWVDELYGLVFVRCTLLLCRAAAWCDLHVIDGLVDGSAALVRGWLWLPGRFQPKVEGFQFVHRAPWFEAFNIEYFVGTDGISITMVVLTALLCFLCMIASFGIEKGVKGYYALFLLLETGMLGVFCALDFFLFFVFWEVMLLPMYFLIGIWGGPRREYAAIKFFLYTLLGSVLMLVTILYLYFASDPHSFDMTQLSRTAHVTMNVQLLLWLALFIGFAIKIPAFPFHTWLPDAHVEAPTAISVILAGVLLKMGTYGILRINYGILPAAAPAPAWHGRSL